MAKTYISGFPIDLRSRSLQHSQTTVPVRDDDNDDDNSSLPPIYVPHYTDGFKPKSGGTASSTAHHVTANERRLTNRNFVIFKVYFRL